MPSTLEGLGVLLVALLPGALTIFAIERVAGRWAIGIGDRILRFIGVSAALHALLAPVTYLVWYCYLRDGALDAGEKLPLWLWFVAMAYVAGPLALGYVIGRGLENDASWARPLGADPPTAWDAVFDGNPTGWVLLRLKSGRWIGGLYHDDSYAGGYPEPPDLFLELEAHVDQNAEDFLVDQNGDPIDMGRGLLVRWDEVEYLEFQ